MSFGDVLAHKVAEIQVKALEHFEKWVLTSRIDNDKLFDLDQDGTRVVPRLGTGHTITEQDVLQRQDFLDELWVLLDRLESNFSRYYNVDVQELLHIELDLCQQETTGLDADNRWPASLGPVPGSASADGTVVGALGRALDPWLAGISNPPEAVVEPVWEGEAAEAFNDGYLYPLVRSVGLLAYCGVYLANVVQIFVNVVKDTQRKLLDIANATSAALDDEEWDRASISDVALAGNLFSFALPPPVDKWIGGISTALDLWARSHETPEREPRFHISSSSWTDVILRASCDHLDTVESDLEDLDRDLGERLLEDEQLFQDAKFRPEDGARPATPTRLIAHLETIYGWGQVHMVSAANHCQWATRTVEDCYIPVQTQVLPGSRREYGYLADMMITALRRAEEHLRFAGQALVDACNTYAAAEEASQAAFERFKEGLPPAENVPYRDPDLYPPITSPHPSL
ncbi:hypothetical protein [Nocardia transvalensis]|uniref:hypothetical protein n=1 Tax=Nocardia transvalensis TaxID=37333 RepID=UPI00189578E3|nr:hypothetical protein [Nocardia transvalensis]MBF6328139.1 hypothetical protein [Nocardia transvalensis]